MEIDIFFVQFWLTVVFKIDLIVWKYEIESSVFEEICGFKIDLIVWKYSNIPNESFSKPGLK